MLGQIFLAVIVTISVLGMTSILVSFFVSDPLPTYIKPDYRYTNCTKPQQASSGVPTQYRKKPQNNSATLYAGTKEESREIPKLNQGQYDPTATFIAQAEDFLRDMPDDLELDEDLLD